MPVPHIYSAALNLPDGQIKGFLTTRNGEEVYCIENYSLMDPFLMSIVSSCDLWMYLSSFGGLTAGRQNYNNALFPYETDDKLHATSEITGSRTVVRIRKGEKLLIWEPFSERYEGLYKIKRNIYKNLSGSKVTFEEVNLSLNLTFSYCYASSDELGWIKTSELKNDSEEELLTDVTDGLQNLLPWGITRETQSMMSTLMDAYKVAEYSQGTGIALFRMSSIPVDRAEPSEALRSNTVWYAGVKADKILLSARQLKNLRLGQDVKDEEILFGQKTSFFIHSKISLKPGKSSQWYIIADVAKDSSEVLELQQYIAEGADNLPSLIEQSIRVSEDKLQALVALADGIQETGDVLNDRRHFANVMFNIMRGGIFEKVYDIELADFLKHLQVCNTEVYRRNIQLYSQMKSVVKMQDLISVAQRQRDNDLLRITLEYLPLSFSRRHGDPSRPWNFFDINVKNADGTPSLNYQGNWRDIFQNWETLAFSFPAFLPGMISRFLNASTADGYNPYRILRDGFDWEVPEPDNPWAFIGYWGDHQIVYLLRLLEMQEKFYPGSLATNPDDALYVYANVPYRIKKYADILKNPQDTIVFNVQLNEQILKKSRITGSDGKLLYDLQGNLHKASFNEKLLLTLLTKVSNLVPEAGIWLNTQRPEWNDANNALVGNGASMVTLYHMRRFVKFFSSVVGQSVADNFLLSDEVAGFFNDIFKTLSNYSNLLKGAFSDSDRKLFVDSNGIAAEAYRDKIYKGFSGKRTSVDKDELQKFFALTLKYLDHSIAANEREEGMYHSYNLLDIGENSVKIEYLYLMLEGQVAILSSGLLNATQTLHLLEALFASALWRKDQQSFMLYPFRTLPNFMEKNIIPGERVSSSSLLNKLMDAGNIDIIKKDASGKYHFNAQLKNPRLLEEALDKILGVDTFANHTSEKQAVLDIYEEVFNHHAFTGRSGSFYKYEGLGSIYWHMVSKLLLAVGESILNIESGQEKAGEDILKSLKEYYYRIKEGIGLYKHPAVYGAFTTDPYSHTPSMMGAQQPGMTGQVKEDILSRFNELGLIVKNGGIHIVPRLLRDNDFNGEEELQFSFCNTPFIYEHSSEKGIKICWKFGPPAKLSSYTIPPDISSEVFNRTDRIDQVRVYI